MIGWDTDVLELLISESATGDIFSLSKAVTNEKGLFIQLNLSTIESKY